MKSLREQLFILSQNLVTMDNIYIRELNKTLHTFYPTHLPKLAFLILSSLHPSFNQIDSTSKIHLLFSLIYNTEIKNIGGITPPLFFTDILTVNSNDSVNKLLQLLSNYELRNSEIKNLFVSLVESFVSLPLDKVSYIKDLFLSYKVSICITNIKDIKDNFFPYLSPIKIAAFSILSPESKRLLQSTTYIYDLLRFTIEEPNSIHYITQLLKAGYDPNLPDDHGFTIIDVLCTQSTKISPLPTAYLDKLKIVFQSATDYNNSITDKTIVHFLFRESLASITNARFSFLTFFDLLSFIKNVNQLHRTLQKYQCLEYSSCYRYCPELSLPESNLKQALLHLAVQTQSSTLVAFLFEKKADFWLRDSVGNNIIHYALSNEPYIPFFKDFHKLYNIQQNSHIISSILHKMLNQPNARGLTPLYATEFSCSNLYKIILIGLLLVSPPSELKLAGKIMSQLFKYYYINPHIKYFNLHDINFIFYTMDASWLSSLVNWPGQFKYALKAWKIINGNINTTFEAHNTYYPNILHFLCSPLLQTNKPEATLLVQYLLKQGLLPLGLNNYKNETQFNYITEAMDNIIVQDIMIPKSYITLENRSLLIAPYILRQIEITLTKQIKKYCISLSKSIRQILLAQKNMFYFDKNTICNLTNLPTEIITRIIYFFEPNYLDNYISTFFSVLDKSIESEAPETIKFYRTQLDGICNRVSAHFDNIMTTQLILAEKEKRSILDRYYAAKILSEGFSPKG